jgi:hypothetical protein
MEAAACATQTTGYTYARREHETTPLYRVFQQHLLTFEQQRTDQSDGRTLPSFVTDELHDFLDYGGDQRANSLRSTSLGRRAFDSSFLARG